MEFCGIFIKRCSGKYTKAVANNNNGITPKWNIIKAIYAMSTVSLLNNVYSANCSLCSSQWNVEMSHEKSKEKQ